VLLTLCKPERCTARTSSSSTDPPGGGKGGASSGSSISIVLLVFSFFFVFVFFFKKCSFLLLSASSEKSFSSCGFCGFFFQVVLFFSLFVSRDLIGEKTVERCTIKYQLSFFHQPKKAIIYRQKEDERKNKRKH